MKSLGADFCFDYSNDDIPKKISRKVDVVIDCVGGPALDTSWQVISDGGRLLCIVEEPDQVKARSRKISASSMFVEPSGDQLKMLAKDLENGNILAPKVVSRSMSDVGTILEQIQYGEIRGKVVLKANF